MTYHRRTVLALVSLTAVISTVAWALTGCTSSETRSAEEMRARATLKLMAAMNGGDADVMIESSTGTLSAQFKDARDEIGPKTDVTLANEEWDGKRLTADMTTKGENGKAETLRITLTPIKGSDNVEVRETGGSVEGTEAEFGVIVLAKVSGEWKVSDYLVGGTQSWVDAVEQSSQQEERPEDRWMSEEDTRPASVCKRNQDSIQSAFMKMVEAIGTGPLADYESGLVTDFNSGPAALTPAYLDQIPHCPTESGEYFYTIETMKDKGTFINTRCSNPEHNF